MENIVCRLVNLKMIIMVFGLVMTSGFPARAGSRDCSEPGCEFQFNTVDFNPSGPTRGNAGDRYPNDYAKTFYCDAPWRVSSLDDVIPLYVHIEGTDADAVNEMHCLGIYDVSQGAVPPEPEESFWGDYEYTPDVASQIYKTECGGCELYRAETGMYWMLIDSFFNDGSMNGAQPDGTPLTARNLGYDESDLGSYITLTFRLIYEESLNWTDIHDQDVRIYLGHGPLPALDNWYLGDSHTHTWSTYYLMEIGASGAAMFRSMRTCGLHWEFVSDHGFNLNDSKWQTILSECAAATVPGQFVAIPGEETDNGYQLDEAYHTLSFGLGNWIETYNTEPTVPELIGLVDAQGGFVYGAHTTTSTWSWDDALIREALMHDCFRGMEDYNERYAYTSSDTLHPWGSNPHTGNWDQSNPDWDADLIAGIRRLDRFLSEKINDARYQVFFLGGSDAHGSMNYHVDWDVLEKDVLYAAHSAALGKIRTAVYSPAGLTSGNILQNLYDGRTVVTDGPIVVLGLSLDGSAVTYADCDAGIADTISVAAGHPDARLFLEWKSSADYGPIRKIRVFRGDDATDESPVVVYQFVPTNGMNGIDLSLEIADMALPEYSDEDPNPDCYLRVEAYTYDPDLGPDAPGDVSIPGYSPILLAYQYRAVTNAMWINVTEACPNDGDVNQSGTLTAADAQMAFFIVLGLYSPDELESCAADCNGSGTITAADAQQIFLTVLGGEQCADGIFPNLEP